MKHYQRKRNNPYRMPHEVYMQVLYIIRDLPRMKRNQKHPVMERRLAAVESALEKLPEEYRQGVLRCAVERNCCPPLASESTWRRWKQRFFYLIAKDLGLIWDDE